MANEALKLETFKTESKGLSPEESFRESLTDIVAIGEKLGQVCNSVDELVAMAKHGLENPGQLNLLMAVCRSK
jgi:hypothetical protein